VGLIYIDSCVVIYFVERHPVFYSAVRAALAAITRGEIAISPLVQAECLVSPMRRGDEVLERRYVNFFRRVTILSFADSVFLEAARILVRHGPKLPDALHLACARHHACSALWTADNRLAAAGGQLVKVLTP
jgi:uncharacterized protein